MGVGHRQTVGIFIGRAAAQQPLPDNPFPALAAGRRRHVQGGANFADSRRFHSITSSAHAKSVGGPSSPSALAVLRLITSSYFTGACTPAPADRGASRA